MKNEELIKDLSEEIASRALGTLFDDVLYAGQGQREEPLQDELVTVGESEDDTEKLESFLDKLRESVREAARGELVKVLGDDQNRRAS